MDEFIYIRRNTHYYDKFNICKLGKTCNIPERDNTYTTGEIKRGYFQLVIQIHNFKSQTVETLLKQYFKDLNVVYDGGKEFYQLDIIERIVPFLNKTSVKFTVLNNDSIKLLTKKNRLKSIFSKINRKELINSLYKISSFKYYVPDKINCDIPKPSEHQNIVLNKINNYFEQNDIGKIIWSCGTGKTLLSLFIVKQLEFKTILIGVPSHYLQIQFFNEIVKIFPNTKNIILVNSQYNNDINTIINFLKLNVSPKFIITSYSSCHLFNDERIYFDFKIGDEAHHLTSFNCSKTNKSHSLFHNIKSHKTMFLTATQKNIECKNNVQSNILSMDDNLLFGKEISSLSVSWAIKNKIINDYNVIVCKSKKEYNIPNYIKKRDIYKSLLILFENIIEHNSLTHMLIYTNNCSNAEIVKKYLKIIVDETNEFKDEQFYINSLHSKSNDNMQTEIEKFKKSKYGIISCVYIFGEGFDLPKLNGVVFVENMISTIRIVQSTLRPLRKDIHNPEKKSYIVLPYLDDNKSLDKCRFIIEKMREIDENIVHKVYSPDVPNLYKKQQSVYLSKKFKCGYCKYRSDKKFNIIKHLSKKIKCSELNNYQKHNEPIIGIHININITEDNDSNKTKEYEKIDDNKVKCLYCMKTLSNLNNFYRHKKHYCRDAEIVNSFFNDKQSSLSIANFKQNIDKYIQNEVSKSLKKISL